MRRRSCASIADSSGYQGFIRNIEKFTDTRTRRAGPRHIAIGLDWELEVNQHTIPILDRHGVWCTLLRECATVREQVCRCLRDARIPSDESAFRLFMIMTVVNNCQYRQHESRYGCLGRGNDLLVLSLVTYFVDEMPECRDDPSG